MINVYSASDYAGVKVGNKEFYYGYEHTWCKTHGFLTMPCECEDTEWAFHVEIEGAIVFERSQTNLNKFCDKEFDQFDVINGLLLGIVAYYETKKLLSDVESKLKKLDEVEE